MNGLLKWLTTAAAVVLPGCVNLLFAQQQTFSLAVLIDSASHHLPVLLQKQAMINSARANETDVRHQFLPKLTAGDEVSVGSANDVAGTYLPFSGVIHATSAGIRGENNYQAQTGNIVSLYGEYELVNFGLRGAKINNAIAYTQVQQADYDRELYLLKWQISKLYFDILKTRYQLAVDEQNMERYQSVYAIIKALAGSGVKAGVDSSLAKAELSKSRVGYNQRSGDLAQLRQQLSYLSGIPAAIINIDTVTQQLNIAAAVTGTDSLNNPLLKYYTQQTVLYRSTEELVKKSYLPKIMLAAGGWGRGSSIQFNDHYQSLADGLGYQRFNYAAGIGITYDLFNGTHRKDKLAVSRYQIAAAGYAQQQQQLALNNTAVQADTAIATASHNLLELPVQLQAASDAWKQKTAQYKAGMINLVDLTNATFVLYTAQLQYAEALNAWYVANLGKAAATGNLDLFIQSLKN
ncbi:TolC family protein [Deminuibacter soli]|nr:TolC family protein [Deminuibacter soli]